MDVDSGGRGKIGKFPEKQTFAVFDILYCRYRQWMLTLGGRGKRGNFSRPPVALSLGRGILFVFGLALLEMLG